MGSFARTTTVRNFNVRDIRKHFGAVVRVVATLPAVSLRLRLIARILLARLDQCVGARHQDPEGLYCHSVAANAIGWTIGCAVKHPSLMWPSPMPTCVILRGKC